MIIYGSRPVHLKTVQLRSTICPNCQTQGSMIMSIYRTHAHIYWIPLFPFKKIIAAECQHCEHYLEYKDMPINMKEQYEYIKADVKGPIWQFAGLGLIAIFIGMSIISSGNQTRVEQQYLEAPAIGDVYGYKENFGEYTTFKVFEVTEDSVFVHLNDYFINKRSAIEEIDRADYYSDSLYLSLSQSKLHEMYADGDITEIIRK